ncbi:hypothetical protein SAMN03159507_01595 [Pseudomonas sp. NFACC32-1]|nr:hypothetical protein SAMN03159507_01595 [Pseudomonas sp. NFACC32-1]
MRKAFGDQDKFVGLWVTADGVIRHRLLPGGVMTKHAVHVKAPIKATTGCRATTSNITTTPVSPPMGIFAKVCSITRVWSCIARKNDVLVETGGERDTPLAAGLMPTGD